MYAGVAFNFKYPFLYLLTALTAGILCSEYLTLSVYFFAILFLIALCCLSKYKLLADIVLLLVIFYIGWYIARPPLVHVEKDSIYLIHSRCEEELPHNNYILSIRRHNFYLSGYHQNFRFHCGDSLTFYARIVVLRENSNPGEFSYSRYLKQKKVYHQFIPQTDIQKNGRVLNANSIFNILREKLIEKTNRLTQDSIYRQLIHALCLGYRNDLDSEFQNLFMNTGTIHLLSVSGLHTGAIFLFLTFIFRHLGLSGKKAKAGILPLLWIYACLTGLSPSVVRASIILTFIIIGQLGSRTYTPVNSLAASAFFTLLIQPSTLYSLSFLLSYSAYSGILLMHPFLYRLPGKLPPVISQVYACCCISISAQLPTLPLSAFYFHTINLNGFLANVIAVPLSTLLLYNSAVCLTLPFFISKYLIIIGELIYRVLIYFLNFFTPYSINLKGLYPSLLTVLLLYGCLLTLFFYFSQRQKYWLHFTIGLLVLLSLNLTTQNLRLSSKTEIIIFHYYQQSLVLLNHKGFYHYLCNTTDTLTCRPLPYIQQNKLKATSSGMGIAAPGLYWEKPYFYWKSDTILMVTSSFAQYTPADILIITGNCSPRQLFTSKQIRKFPGIIIADGSNNRHTVQEWYEFCIQHKIIFQNTAESGYVCLPLK